MPKEEQSSTRSHQGLPQGGGVEHSLDELAKGLATGTLSRGKAIRWMGGALLGAALASFPGVAWADGCRRLGRECRRDFQCCSKNCIRRGDDKVCGCPEGKSRCGVRCVNLDRNENHCGECFNRCAAEETCVNGACCPNAQVCGTGTSLTCCAEGQECVGGTCAASCPPDTKLCNNGQCANCCDNADCSGCATCQSGTCACPSGTVLVNGACARSCTGGASCPTGFCYGTDQGTFCAGGGSVGNCLGLGTAVCPTGSVCTGRDCLTVVC